MNKYFILIVCLMFFYSCSEENNNTPVTDDPTVPGQVSNVRVESLPGAVKLTYDLPSSQNLSYVKAECLINGVVREVIASSYTNNLTIEGFADETEYTVNLYSVSRSEKASEPVAVQVKPLAPPFREVFKTLEMKEDWGGVSVYFENPSEDNLAISLIYKDDDGFWDQVETIYTKSMKGPAAVRGLESKETTFGVYIRDRWNNTSDTLVKELIPRYEKQLDLTKFKPVQLPGDATASAPSTMDRIFDGDIAKQNNAASRCFLSAADGQWPHWITFDMGVEQGALLSRCKIWQRGMLNREYGDRNPKKFEIWGSMNPSSDGSWDSWTLLLDGEIIKPSGLPLGQFSDEDIQAYFDGHEFEFPSDIPYVRYIRFKVKETWTNGRVFILNQIWFWGMEPSDIR